MALAPVVYWRLGESAGTTAEDETANNIDGTYSNVVLAATGCITGDANTSVKFEDHNDAKCDVALVSGLPTGVSDDWTIMFWHRTRTVVEASHYFGFGATPTDAGAATGTRRGVILFNDHYYFWGESADWDTGYTFDRFEAGTQPGDFIVFTCDGTNLRLYRNGILVAGPQAIPYAAVALTTVTAGSHLSIGTSPNADIDECAIFDFALSAGQVDSLYASGRQLGEQAAGSGGIISGIVPEGRAVRMTLY